MLIAPTSSRSPQPPGSAALEAFVSVAWLGSFHATATAHGVAPSAFSHSMRILEARLGTRLFHRTSRSVRLTDAGERLLARLGPALGEIEDAAAALGAEVERPSRRLRLNVPHSAVPLIIAPLLPRFLAEYPAVVLDVVADDGLVDIVAAGFDAGIRPEWRLAPGMVAVPLRPHRRFAVVAAPSFLERPGIPETPADLASHACIIHRYPSGGRYAWEFARGGETLQVEVDGRIATNDPALMRTAALAGGRARAPIRAHRRRGAGSGNAGARAGRVVSTAAGRLALLPGPAAATTGAAGLHRNAREILLAGDERS